MNKPFELEGYMVPIKDGMKQTKFMLSTLPINQCYFCVKTASIWVSFTILKSTPPTTAQLADII